jgi:hypothetical protein
VCFSRDVYCSVATPCSQHTNHITHASVASAMAHTSTHKHRILLSDATFLLLYCKHLAVLTELCWLTCCCYCDTWHLQIERKVVPASFLLYDAKVTYLMQYYIYHNLAAVYMYHVVYTRYMSSLQSTLCMQSSAIVTAYRCFRVM